MTTAAVAAGAAALTALIAYAWSLRARRRLERAVAHALRAVDGHARLVTETLERGIRRAAEARARGVSGLELSLDLEELASRAAAETAAAVGAPAAAVRVEGLEGSSVVGAFGQNEAKSILERIPVPPDAQPFRALTVSWGPSAAADAAGRYRSALVVPILEDGARSGLVAACAPEADAFGGEHVDALERLARDVATALPTCRRFARIARHAGRDAALGGPVHDRHESRSRR